MLAGTVKTAKFGEKSRFLGRIAVENVRKCVRGWLKNAIGMSCTRWVFQKVTAGVSPVKQPVRQNEMGIIGENNHFVDANKMVSRSVKT